MGQYERLAEARPHPLKVLAYQNAYGLEGRRNLFFKAQRKASFGMRMRERRGEENECGRKTARYNGKANRFPSKIF